ncbi:MAG: hypothetical protein MI865_06675 [Proteobacteria bacterium]|nr:hypothetical protein [Pseudomonadota bacterium]
MKFVIVVLLVAVGSSLTTIIGFLEFVHLDHEACRSNLCACEDPETGIDYNSGYNTGGGYCKYSDAIFWYLTNKMTLVIYTGWFLVGLISYVLLKNKKQAPEG